MQVNAVLGRRIFGEPLVTPADFVKTIYLGDRGCKGIFINAWEERIEVWVDDISRIRGESWDFYTDEDIPDGRIVFSGARSVRFDPPGPIPNDYIHSLSVVEDEEGWRFTLSVASVESGGARAQVAIEIGASSIHLEDPRRPGEKIYT